MSEWQSIGSAPRNGTHLLLAVRTARYTKINFIGKRVFAGYFQAQGNEWVVEGNWGNDMKITHWMPLPDPPK